MNDIIIDREFRDLLPELDDETYRLLEENLIQNGCRDALVVWGDILIDGHNRFSICKKHDIPFTTVEKAFDSREEALIWIITTQVARRNLTQIQLSHCRGLHYNADKILVTNAAGKNQFSKPEEAVLLDAHPRDRSTATRLADYYNVSRNTIIRDSKTAAAIDAIGEVSHTAKKKILSRETFVNRKKLGVLAEAKKEEIEEMASAIENGTYNDRKKASEQTLSEPLKPADKILAGMNRLYTALDKIAADFSTELAKITDTSERAKLKIELKPCLDLLGGLYEQI